VCSNHNWTSTGLSGEPLQLYKSGRPIGIEKTEIQIPNQTIQIYRIIFYHYKRDTRAIYLTLCRSIVPQDSPYSLARLSDKLKKGQTFIANIYTFLYKNNAVSPENTTPVITDTYL
jgi:hypothetical protein